MRPSKEGGGQWAKAPTENAALLRCRLLLNQSAHSFTSTYAGLMSASHPLAVFGDWHGAAGWALASIRSAAREGVRTAIHVGDFGLDWPGAKRGRYEAKLNKYLIDLGITLVVSGGNHDNWDTLEKLLVEDDGLATTRSNIRVLPRRGRAMIEGLAVGGLGGAFSVDYEHRTVGKDWWANEEPTREEADALIAGGPLDILITHDAPAGVPLTGEFQLSPDLTEKANKTRDLLGEVVNSLAVPHLFCGHWASAAHTRVEPFEWNRHQSRRAQYGKLPARERRPRVAWPSSSAD